MWLKRDRVTSASLRRAAESWVASLTQRRATARQCRGRPSYGPGPCTDVLRGAARVPVGHSRIVGGLRWISLLPPGGSCAVGLMRAPSAGIWTGVSLPTGDIMDVYHQWTQSGVAFDSPPARHAWGARAAVFADIDRNRFQLVEVPIDCGNPTDLATLRDPTVADGDFDPGLREFVSSR
jgi:hypothetical protein